MSKTVAWVFGVILVIAGLWGFVQSPVLGLFPVNTLLTLVWLVAGLLLLAAAMGWVGGTRLWFIILGVIYALLALWGFFASSSAMSLFGADMTDAWLHALLAVIFLVVGFMDKGESSMPMGSSAM